MPDSPLGPFPSQAGVDQLVWLIRAPLLYSFPPEGLALWLAGSIVLATYLPAHRASQLSVREVLAYE